ncbi:MAG: hypothetical protein J3K34DRAFT_490117 [Monoraphidium minutum]|nr:MAG: hypothetical protein J3K34DRAFT_490117 [Monoraphidium minutum]
MRRKPWRFSADIRAGRRCTSSTGPGLRLNAWSNDAYLEGLARCVEQGLTQTVGVSNFNADRVRGAAKTLKARGAPLSSNQVQFSLLYRKPLENGVMEACQENGVTLVAYSPLCQGLLTGKYTPGGPKPSGPRAGIYTQKIAEVQPLIEVMRAIGDGRGGKTPAQVALNWTVCKGALPIPGAKSAKQVQEIAGSVGWRLEEGEVMELDKAAAKIKSPLGAPFENWSECLQVAVGSAGKLCSHHVTRCPTLKGRVGAYAANCWADTGATAIAPLHLPLAGAPVLLVQQVSGTVYQIQHILNPSTGSYEPASPDLVSLWFTRVDVGHGKSAVRWSSAGKPRAAELGMAVPPAGGAGGAAGAAGAAELYGGAEPLSSSGAAALGAAAAGLMGSGGGSGNGGAAAPSKPAASAAVSGGTGAPLWWARAGRLAMTSHGKRSAEDFTRHTAHQDPTASPLGAASAADEDINYQGLTSPRTTIPAMRARVNTAAAGAAGALAAGPAGSPAARRKLTPIKHGRPPAAAPLTCPGRAMFGAAAGGPALPAAWRVPVAAAPHLSRGGASSGAAPGGGGGGGGGGGAGAAPQPEPSPLQLSGVSQLTPADGGSARGAGGWLVDTRAASGDAGADSAPEQPSCGQPPPGQPHSDPEAPSTSTYQPQPGSGLTFKWEALNRIVPDGLRDFMRQHEALLARLTFPKELPPELAAGLEAQLGRAQGGAGVLVFQAADRPRACGGSRTWHTRLLQLHEEVGYGGFGTVYLGRQVYPPMPAADLAAKLYHTPARYLEVHRLAPDYGDEVALAEIAKSFGTEVEALAAAAGCPHVAESYAHGLGQL